MIVEKIEQWVQSQARVTPQYANRASELGHPCLRYLVFLRTKWDQRSPYSVGTLLRFLEGQLHENAVIDLLRRAGFVIVEQQRTFYWEKYQISGHIDGKVMIEGKTYPLEIKSVSPFIWPKLNSIEDMKRSKFMYIRKYPAQMMIYLLLDNSERGVMLLKNKSSGQLKEIWVDLDYDLAEEMVQKAEAVNRHIEEGTVPNPIEYDEEICGQCPFVHICMPDVFRHPIGISEDLELIEKLERWWELKPLAEEFRNLDADLSKAFEGVDRMLIGDFLITGKWVERKAYTVPESRYWRKSIKKLVGGSHEHTGD